ncbi:MAG TPA: universal stress protein [Solirubrobacteraceae bacterium]
MAIAPDGYRHRHAPLATIGVGLGDGTERAATLALGRQLAADERATLRALHVVQIATWVTPPNVFAGINYDAALREWEDRLGALEDVAGTVVLGTRVGELAKFADALDLLVLGSCERSRAGRVLFGSTAEALAGRITVPLLVAPRSARDASGAEAADAA